MSSRGVELKQVNRSRGLAGVRSETEEATIRREREVRAAHISSNVRQRRDHPGGEVHRTELHVPPPRFCVTCMSTNPVGDAPAGGAPKTPKRLAPSRIAMRQEQPLRTSRTWAPPRRFAGTVALGLARWADCPPPGRPRHPGPRFGLAMLSPSSTATSSPLARNRCRAGGTDMRRAKYRGSFVANQLSCAQSASAGPRLTGGLGWSPFSSARGWLLAWRGAWRREWDLNPRCPLLDTAVFETAPFGRSGIPPRLSLGSPLLGLVRPPLRSVRLPVVARRGEVNSGGR